MITHLRGGAVYVPLFLFFSDNYLDIYRRPPSTKFLRGVFAVTPLPTKFLPWCLL